MYPSSLSLSVFLSFRGLDSDSGVFEFPEVLCLYETKRQWAKGKKRIFLMLLGALIISGFSSLIGV